MQLSMHAAYAARWGVDSSTTSPSVATLAYADLLLATSATGPSGWCRSNDDRATACTHISDSRWPSRELRADSTYGSWVTAYADPAFGILADQLEALLDAHATDTPAVVRRRTSRAMPPAGACLLRHRVYPDAAPASMTSARRATVMRGTALTLTVSRSSTART